MEGARRRLSWAARQPAIHFLAIGALLYGAARLLPGDGGGRPRLVVPARQIEELRSEWADVHGRKPTEEEDAALRRRAAEEELLFREALALGLERGDRTVRFHLARNMRFLGYGDAAEGGTAADDEALFREALDIGLHRTDTVIRRYLVAKLKLAAKVPGEAEPPVDDAQLSRYLERHRERWQRPPVASLSHVFLSAERRNGTLEADARNLLARLRGEGPDRGETPAGGDPFPLGNHVSQRSHDEIERAYGAAMADAAMTFEPGVWSGPVRSRWGLHLVRVDERRPASLPELDAVRSQVLGAIAEERRAERLRGFVDALAQRYDVVVEDDAHGTGR